MQSFWQIQQAVSFYLHDPKKDTQSIGLQWFPSRLFWEEFIFTDFKFALLLFSPGLFILNFSFDYVILFY